MNNYYTESDRFENLDREEDYQNTESSSVIAGMYAQFSMSSCPMGGVAVPMFHEDR